MGLAGQASPPAPVVDRQDVCDQALFDSEHGIVFEPRTIPREDVRRHRLEAIRADDEMDVSRPVGIAVKRPEHLADRTIIWDRIVARVGGAKGIATLGVGLEEAAQIVIRLDARLLHVIKALGVCLPDVEEGPRDRTALNIANPARYPQWFTPAVEADITPVRIAWRVVAVILDGRSSVRSTS
jgi:hypothetical protein